MPGRPGLGGRLLGVAALLWLLLELVVVIYVGAQIGALAVIGVLALSSLLGAIVVARAGSRAWAALRTDAAEGIVPGRELGNPVILLVCGIFLILPGLVSSALSLLAILLLPLTRMVTKVVFRGVFGVRMPPGVVPGQPMPHDVRFGPGPHQRSGAGESRGRSAGAEEDIIEGEIIEETPPERGGRDD